MTRNCQKINWQTIKTQLIPYVSIFSALYSEDYCPMVFDSLLCWPRTKAGEKVWQKCPDGVRGLDGESKSLINISRGTINLLCFSCGCACFFSSHFFIFFSFCPLICKSSKLYKKSCWKNVWKSAFGKNFVTFAI